jgi:hypothetical protein
MRTPFHPLGAFADLAFPGAFASGDRLGLEHPLTFHGDLGAVLPLKVDPRTHVLGGILRELRHERSQCGHPQRFHVFQPLGVDKKLPAGRGFLTQDKGQGSRGIRVQDAFQPHMQVAHTFSGPHPKRRVHDGFSSKGYLVHDYTSCGDKMDEWPFHAALRELRFRLKRKISKLIFFIK